MSVFWNRIVALIVVWTLFVGINELLFFTSLRNGGGLGSGGEDYGVAFSREKYFRDHFDDPCPLNGGQQCTPEQVAVWQAHVEEQLDLYQDYHKRFRADMINRSRSFLFFAGMLLAVGCVIISSFEFWHHRKKIFHKMEKRSM